MTYPVKFREQALSLRKKEQLTVAQTAERFGVSMASVVRWGKKLQPVMKRHKPATKINMAALAEDVIKFPDAYLYERASRFKVSKTGIECALKRLGVTRKKNSGASKNRRRFQSQLSDENSNL